MKPIDEIKKMNSDYFRWLRDKEVLREVNGQWTEISTPFLDRHNDNIEIYAKRIDDKIIMTDDGYIISDLQMCGFDIESPKRRSVLHELLSSSRVKCVEQRLEISCTPAEFSQSKHSLIQAMISVNDMFYSAPTHTNQIFTDKLANWLEDSGVCYISHVYFQGKTGLFHNFFGTIPRSKDFPERIIEPINHPDKNSVIRLLFEWDDTKETRSPGTMLFPILNDSDKQNIKEEFIDAFKSHGIECLCWSKRKDFLSKLAV